jgi:hypothetical protein
MITAVETAKYFVFVALSFEKSQCLVGRKSRLVGTGVGASLCAFVGMSENNPTNRDR